MKLAGVIFAGSLLVNVVLIALIVSLRRDDARPMMAAYDVLVELCGPVLRLDHAYGIVMAPGTTGLGLHGGGTPFDPAQFYVVNGGRISCGLVAVQWSLVGQVFRTWIRGFLP